MQPSPSAGRLTMVDFEGSIIHYYDGPACWRCLRCKLFSYSGGLGKGIAKTKLALLGTGEPKVGEAELTRGNVQTVGVIGNM